MDKQKSGFRLDSLALKLWFILIFFVHLSRGTNVAEEKEKGKVGGGDCIQRSNLMFNPRREKVLIVIKTSFFLRIFIL